MASEPYIDEENNRTLPKDQQKLADAAANAADNSADNKMGFLNKGLTEFFGSGVDTLTGGLNEITTLRNKANNFMSGLAGRPAPKEMPLLDQSKFFGGTASLQRGLENVGAAVPKGEPQTLGEQIAYGIGGLGSYAIPSKAAPTAVKAAIDLTRGASWFAGGDSSGAENSAVATNALLQLLL